MQEKWLGIFRFNRFNCFTHSDVTERIIKIHGFQKVSESVTGSNDLSLSDGQSLVNVILGKSNALGNSCVDNCRCKLVGFSFPCFRVEICSVCQSIQRMSFFKLVDFDAEFYPILFRKRKWRVNMEFVDNCVPHSMKLICTVMIGQWEIITTLISFRVLFVNSCGTVQRLVSVADIVN